MAAGNPSESTVVAILSASLLVLYFVPSVLAFCLHHNKRKVILLVNLLTGWSLLGWAVAAVWSSTAVNSNPGTEALVVKQEETDHAA